MTRPIIDSHLDIAWNAVSFNRDLTLSVTEIRDFEKHMTDEPCRGHSTTSLPELRLAGMAICVGTLLARSGPDQQSHKFNKRTDLDYTNQSIAYATAQGQLAYYKLLEQQGEIRIIHTRNDLEKHWQQWLENNGKDVPIGVILSLEGTDPIISPDKTETWWNDGLRAAGLAHYGRSHYAYGTNTNGGLSKKGIDILKEFSRLQIVLDVTHLCDESMYQALDLFTGRVLASHHNCRSLVPGDRQLTDQQIRLLIEREAVIGIALDAWMLYPGWERGKTSPSVVSLEAIIDHIDHICQIAGNVKHCEE